MPVAKDLMHLVTSTPAPRTRVAVAARSERGVRAAVVLIAGWRSRGVRYIVAGSVGRSAIVGVRVLDHRQRQGLFTCFVDDGYW